MADETRRYTVAEAARLLGITETAVRARVQRGTLDSEREEGTVYVRLSADDTIDKSNDQYPLIDALRDQITTLQRQLDEANAANRENRRIIAALTQRIPAIESPPESSSGIPESPVTASEEKAKGDVPPEPKAAESEPWWRRIFK